MMKKRIKRGGALIFAAVLALSALVIPKAFAADGVKVDANCSLTVDVTGTGYNELKTYPITVNLYKVADITVTGQYTSLVKDVVFTDIDSETTAEEWKEKTEAVVANLGDMAATAKDDTVSGVVTINKDVNGNNLKPGLYLVSADTVNSDYYTYDFTPYLISLPNNYWNNTAEDNEIPGSAKEEEKVTDKWIYDVPVSLKPSRTDRYGDLVIDKTLTSYNATVGGATFIFEVKAVKTDVDTEKETVVYNDVVSMTFDNTGKEQIVIKNIEAGALVKVTEVYSGASYQLVAANGETQIIAEDVVNVSFENTYNEGFNGGNGIVNTFTPVGEKFDYVGNSVDSTGNEIIAKNLETIEE